MARKSSTQAQQLRLVPSASSFDFLEGAFAAAERARKVGIAIVMFAVTTLTVLVLFGVGGMLSKQSSEDLLTQTDANNAVAVSKLAKLDSAGGMSVNLIDAHVRERQGALEQAVKGEIDVVKLTQMIEAAPSGVDIASITFAEAGAAAAATDSGTDTAAAPTTTTSPDSPGTVTIVATVHGFALISAWKQSLMGVTGLDPASINASWTGGGEAVTTTMTADLSTLALTRRAQTGKAQ